MDADTDEIATYAREHVRIKLVNQDNYVEWKLKMEEFLKANGMLGYVNGEEEHPDPRGEPENEDLRLRSEKWKRDDEQVMNWIKTSLNDIFNYMVRETKSSKEMWNTLVSFFTGDAIALLNSLEDSQSRSKVGGLSVDRLDKENYQTWRDRMIKFFDSERTICFIVGTLRDLDPKGESGDDLVRVYSLIWKRLDKRVMELMMTSLTYELKYMVEEMKTTKELWDTLEMFFTTEELGPLDSNSITKLENETNYIEWKEKTESFLVNENMGGFIDGTFRDPSKISRSIRQRYEDFVKVYSERWTLLDQRVMTLIKNSLSVILCDIVKDLKSSEEVWRALEILFTTGYPVDIPVIEANFPSIKLSGKENYIQWAQQIKYLLEMHGLQNLIDPLSRPPPATFGNHEKWKNCNWLLKTWIFSSLEQNVIDKTLAKIPTATGLWGEIKNLYDPEKTRLVDEYRTLDLLNSLDLRISLGKSVRDTSFIMLVYEYNYQPWRNKMMQFLDSQGMKGFIDGTLRYPGPTGESAEGHMRWMYSVIWKRFDKQVMQWIMDSLTDIFKCMVEETKTSKDMWDTLEMFFTTDPEALLASIKDSHSHGEGVIKTIDIKLLDEDNYHPWRDQTMEFLCSLRMTAFIDGTLRDPDPKGESEDKDVRRYSEKWKKLDKQVMEWIMASLNDILNNMVEEMKTTKELWDTLETFFTTDPEALSASIKDSHSHGEGVTKTIYIELLDKDNYQPWRDQMMEFLYSPRLTAFVDGRLRDPDPKGDSEEERVWRYSEKWKRLDKLIMEGIMASLNDILNNMVEEMKTAKELWDTLEMFFTTDTRALSASLEDNHSHGEVVMKTFDIKLIDKENYQPWWDQMMAYLNSQRMKAFIDGTLRDPDPKGESEEECVRIYSEKWKKLDKRVMKWIMASLNDILYYMVEKTKTAKDLWETSQMFFYKEDIRPLDSNSLSKLNYDSVTSYVEWKEMAEKFLVNEKMGGFIDGTFRDPSKISRSIRQRDKAIVKKYSERWTLLDQLVMTLIKSSLSVILQDFVDDLKSSKEVWHALEILFTTGYPFNTPVYEAGFLSIKLSGKENYLPWAVQIKNLLEFHGLQNLIDPLSRPPPATFENHVHWKKYNELFKGWIFSSLAINVIDETLTRIPTATGLWGEIKNRYGPSDVEYTDLKGGYNHANYTALYTAIMSGDLTVTTRELDKYGYDFELTEDGPTPLHVIIVTRKKNHHYFEKVLDHVVQLIEKEALESTSTSTNPITLVNLVNRDGRNTLHRAALVGNLHAAKRLVDKDPYLLFKEDNDECLPIHVAISTPHKDTFQYLLIASKKHLNILGNKKITDSFGLINPFEGKHGVRLLNAAIEAGYMEVAYQLIKMNADIAAENDGNSFRTPLYRIVENYDKYYSLPIRWKIFDQGKNHAS